MVKFRIVKVRGSFIYYISEDADSDRNTLRGVQFDNLETRTCSTNFVP